MHVVSQIGILVDNMPTALDAILQILKTPTSYCRRYSVLYHGISTIKVSYRPPPKFKRNGITSGATDR